MPQAFRLDDVEIAQSEDVWEQPQVIGLYEPNGQVESIYTFEEDSESLNGEAPEINIHDDFHLRIDKQFTVQNQIQPLLVSSDENTLIKS